MLDQKLKQARKLKRKQHKQDAQQRKRIYQNLIRESNYTKPELRSRKRAANFILSNNPDLFSKRGLKDFKANFKDEKVGDLLEFYSEDIEIFFF